MSQSSSKSTSGQDFGSDTWDVTPSPALPPGASSNPNLLTWVIVGAVALLVAALVIFRR